MERGTGDGWWNDAVFKVLLLKLVYLRKHLLNQMYLNVTRVLISDDSCL